MKRIFKLFSLKNGCLLLLFLILPLLGYSQSIWIKQPETETTIGLESVIPAFEGDGYDSPTGLLFVYANIVLAHDVNLQVDLPVSRLGNSDTGIGNPYLGIEFSVPDKNLKFDLGVRLPAFDFSLASGLGVVLQPHRVGTFWPDGVTITVNADYRYGTGPGFFFRVGGGPVLIFPDSFDDGELLLKYYGQLLYNINQLTFGGGLVGRASVTAGGLTLEERTLHSVGLLGSYDFGMLNAGAYLRRSLDDALNDALNFVAGLNLAVSF